MREHRTQRLTGDFLSNPGTPALWIIAGRVRRRRTACGHVAVILQDDGPVTLGVVGLRAREYLSRTSGPFYERAADALTTSTQAIVFAPAFVQMHLMFGACYAETRRELGPAVAARGLEFRCGHSAMVVPNENDYFGVVGVKASHYYEQSTGHFDEVAIARKFHIGQHEEMVVLGDVGGRRVGNIGHMLAESCLNRRTSVPAA